MIPKASSLRAAITQTNHGTHLYGSEYSQPYQQVRDLCLAKAPVVHHTIDSVSHYAPIIERPLPFELQREAWKGVDYPRLNRDCIQNLALPSVGSPSPQIGCQ